MRQYVGRCVMLVCVLLIVGVSMGGRSFAETGGYLSPISVVAGVDSKLLYIVEATADQVAVFDIASGKVTRVISVGENPVGLDISFRLHTSKKAG